MKKRKDGRYQKCFTVKGKRYAVYGNTVKETEEKARKKIEDIENSDLQNNKITFGQYFNIWLSARDGVVKDSTYYQYKKLSVRLIKYFSNVKMKDLTTPMINKFIADMRGEKKASTINAYLTLLKTIFNDAVKENVIIKSPACNVKKLKQDKKIRENSHRALTEYEMNKFVSATATTLYGNIYVFLKETGCRCGEAVAITWQDINWKNHTADIKRTESRDKEGNVIISETPKSEASIRTIPLSTCCIKALKDQKKRQTMLQVKDFGNYIFTNEWGKKASVSTIDANIKKWCKKLDIKDFQSHAFRHTYATNAANAGVRPEILAKVLGHKDTTMLYNVYYHHSSEVILEELKKLSSY